MSVKEWRNEIQAAGCLVAMGGVGSILIAIGYFLYQSLQWLRVGEWPAFSVLDFLAKMFSNGMDWFVYQGDWVGVHKLLSHIPFTGAAFVIGVAVLVLSVK